MTNDEQFLEALKGFKETAEKLSGIWLDNEMADFIGIEDYPKSLPSFDDFVIEVKKWHQTQKTIINQLSIF